MFVGQIISFVKWEVFVFLGGLAAIIAYQLLNGQINTRYLLYGTQKDGTKYFSTERVQLLLFTLGVAVFYLSDVMQKRQSGALPDISTQTLVLLGGSHAVYLGGKAYMMLLKNIRKGEQ